MAAKESRGHKMADPGLLDKIDKLFACNVGDHVDLPQLVVIGDQSSGKSSVLEGLTELPFPRDSGLCTRFATQIIFRRALNESISVSVIPAGDSEPTHKDQASAWRPKVTKLDAQAFAKIMGEVAYLVLPVRQKLMAIQVPSVMGLPATRTEGINAATFSNDVLRLEIHGPCEEHLSVIDVPGIFKNTTPGLTTKQDIAIVTNMVQGFMKNPRSVMIAVVPANVDIATQEILEMAREVDPEGQRTIGVFTKPDLVDKGAETSVVDLLQGKGPNGKLGWSMVRNPGQKELKDATVNRHDLEKQFFRIEAPWNTIDKDRVGIPALRTRLQERLAAHIRREFPKVRMEINKRLVECKEELASLGANRETREEQRAYLLDIASEFQSRTQLALTAQYGGQICFNKDHALRLPTIIASRNESFGKDLAEYGHQYIFHENINAVRIELNGTPNEVYASLPKIDTSSSVKSTSNGKIQGKPESPARVIRKTLVRKHPNHTDIDDILVAEKSVEAPSRASITQWLEQVYADARGLDLGTFNPGLLRTTMYDQSTKWEDIALGYTSDVVAIVHNYIVRMIVYLCADENVRERISALLHDDLLERYNRGIDMTKFILHCERLGTPQTQNHYFNETLEKCRQKRREHTLDKKSFNASDHGKVIRFDDLLQSDGPMSNTEHTIREMHDILRAYYQVAQKRFIDYVCIQAADHHLINGPKSPLKLFSPSYVMGLSEEQMDNVASEDPALRRRRKNLRKEIEDLEAGRKILM
ncbi:MAG: hypothetical protein M1820_006815 [Bogoriella megaspora]|nr:MAG: hypothetical protein M1820_006815 [Bogoriella megaspora]